MKIHKLNLNLIINKLIEGIESKKEVYVEKTKILRFHQKEIVIANWIKNKDFDNQIHIQFLRPQDNSEFDIELLKKEVDEKYFVDEKRKEFYNYFKDIDVWNLYN